MSATEDETRAAIDRELARGGVESEEAPVEEVAPTYKMIGDSKIATSSQHGKLWHSRRDQALAQRKAKCEDVAWEESIAYYNNVQVPYRMDSDGNWKRNEHLSSKMIRGHSETENVVFANVSATVPATYAKNPDVAVAHDLEESEYPFPPDSLETLINRLLQKRSSPGIDLKPHARRAVVHTALTNLSYIEVGYTFREQSNTQAAEDLERLSQQLVDAESQDEIRRIEGEIQALESTMDFLRPAGPWAKFRRADQVLRDTDCEDEGLENCRWVMCYDYVSTAFILGKYAVPSNKEEGETPEQYRSIYEPTHVMNITAGGEAGHQRSAAAPDDIYAFSLLEDEEKKGHDYKYYGYDDERAWNRALRTKVWYVWDKVTRRVYLYNDKDWTWPIWVWDDPYNLEGFYPFFPLSFYTDPCEGTGKSEVSYYLDQQDAINEINSEFNKARHWARRNIFYDKNKVAREDVEKYLKGDEDCALGVDVPEGMKLNDIVQAALPPSMQFVELFDKAPILEAIDRVSSVNDVLRGTQFKTNTTNEAISTYTSGQETRLDEKVDAVEDMIGRVGWAVAQMCLQFMDADTVKKLIGRKRAEGWQNLSPDDIQEYYSMSVVGGSTTKPTSNHQKRVALEMGQVLGQFVQAAPQATISVLMRVFERAFPEVVVSDEDWQTIHQGVGSPGLRPPATPDQGGPGGDPIAQLEQIVDSLPPEAKQALGVAMARGVPVREALQRVMGAVQQQQPQPQPAA